MNASSWIHIFIYVYAIVCSMFKQTNTRARKPKTPLTSIQLFLFFSTIFALSTTLFFLFYTELHGWAFDLEYTHTHHFEISYSFSHIYICARAHARKTIRFYCCDSSSCSPKRKDIEPAQRHKWMCVFNALCTRAVIPCTVDNAFFPIRFRPATSISHHLVWMSCSWQSMTFGNCLNCLRSFLLLENLIVSNLHKLVHYDTQSGNEFHWSKMPTPSGSASQVADDVCIEKFPTQNQLIVVLSDLK